VARTGGLIATALASAILVAHAQGLESAFHVAMVVGAATAAAASACAFPVAGPDPRGGETMSKRTCSRCDESPLRHATMHFQASGHPIIEGYDPPEGWGWCFKDKATIDLGANTTPQDGPIPRFY